ncbi:hypothetical protein [Flammeovirga sp. SJP92]|uniref:hypothetical protein n=1 Tax=Flammeovirga sp. SJP92 TaxID=1775430 RepID=UPI000788BDB7|nr:hypothetical protein [Flammeovirga sp. SJP92]KXX67832.1 hypothetical protein AVL50_25565 [Flammeovirga sp. SJP92]
MKELTKASLLLLLAFIGFSCQHKNEELTNVSEELYSSLRMPFNQRVFLLNSANGKSIIYEVNYDFQGLQGEATLTELETSEQIPAGGHMCISPDNKYITVVVAKKSKIFLVDIETGEVRSSILMGYKHHQLNTSIDQVRANPQAYYMRKIGGITQVDVDQEGYLFIAGKAGFYRVVSDKGNGTVDPSGINTGKDIWTEIWNRQDPSLSNNENWVHALEYKFSNNLEVESTEDGEEYFEDVTPFNPKKVRFQGGDILFTQNASETDGFEQQRLISFSQWKGGTAIYLELQWNYETMEISFDAGKIFGGLNKARDPETKSRSRRAGRVTGAALTGDNLVMTSHHKSNNLQLRTLDGEIVDAEIAMQMSDGSPGLVHNWGDMASTQAFDKNTSNTSSLSNKELNGEYYNAWYRGDLPNHQYAEVKIYRPGINVEQYEVLDLSEDNHNISTQSRRNSANADIADYSKNGSKFVSLGGGTILMRFPSNVMINENTVLQVVETSWNKSAEYATIEDAFNAYGEKAEVSILIGNNARYFSDELLNDPNWVSLGHASIANNEFDLGTYSGEFTWVKIEDNASDTPDGFDVNFISTFDNQ